MPLRAEPILPCAQLTGLLFESPLFCRQHLDLLLNVSHASPLLIGFVLRLA